MPDLNKLIVICGVDGFIGGHLITVSFSCLGFN